MTTVSQHRIPAVLILLMSLDPLVKLFDINIQQTDYNYICFHLSHLQIGQRLHTHAHEQRQTDRGL